MCYRSSFLVKGSTSALERCECHERSPQWLNILTLFSGEPATKGPSSLLHYDALEGGSGPVHDVGALHTLETPHQ